MAFMRSTACVAVLLAPWAVAGCRSCDAPGDEASASSVASERLEEPASGLRIGGQAVPLAAALALGTAGQTAVRLSFATEALSCDALRAEYPGRPERWSAQRIDLWFSQPWQPDGSVGPWSYASGFFVDASRDRALVARGAYVSDFSVQGGSLLARGLDLAMQAGRQEIYLSGDVELGHCGRLQRPEPARPQTELELWIAEKRVSVSGASFRLEAGKRFLRLTEVPHDCASIVTEGYDVVVDLAIGGEPVALEFAALRGDLFPDTPAGSQGKESFELALDGPLDGTGPLGATLRGQLDVAGYALRLDGKLEATRCLLK